MILFLAVLALVAAIFGLLGVIGLKLMCGIIIVAMVVSLILLLAPAVRRVP